MDEQPYFPVLYVGVGACSCAAQRSSCYRATAFFTAVIGCPFGQFNHSNFTYFFSPRCLELVSSEALLNCRAQNWTELASAEHSGRTQTSSVMILHIVCHPEAYLLFVQVITGNSTSSQLPAPFPLLLGRHPALATAI